MDYKCPWCGFKLIEAPGAGWWTCTNPGCISPRLTTRDVHAIRATRARELAEAVSSAAIQFERHYQDVIAMKVTAATADLQTRGDALATAIEEALGTLDVVTDKMGPALAAWRDKAGS